MQLRTQLAAGKGRPGDDPMISRTATSSRVGAVLAMLALSIYVVRIVAVKMIFM